jgi:pullulanase
MQLDRNGGNYGPYKNILVVFNASVSQQNFTAPSLEGMGFRLHPEQQISTDSIVKTSKFDRNTGTVVAPGLTTAVFVSLQ